MLQPYHEVINELVYSPKTVEERQIKLYTKDAETEKKLQAHMHSNKTSVMRCLL